MSGCFGDTGIKCSEWRCTYTLEDRLELKRKGHPYVWPCPQFCVRVSVDVGLVGYMCVHFSELNPMADEAIRARSQSQSITLTLQ